MSTSKTAVVLHTDRLRAKYLQSRFQEVGWNAHAIVTTPLIEHVIDAQYDIVVVGAKSKTEGASLLAWVRRCLRKHDLQVPVLFVGRVLSHESSLVAGADDSLANDKPAASDLQAVCQFLSAAQRKDDAVGDLGDDWQVVDLVRGVSALGKSGVLRFRRGLRRAELCFRHGQLRSAQVGILRGPAAFQQLLLWTRAQYWFRPESLALPAEMASSRDGLLAEASRFLTQVRALAGELVFDGVYQRREMPKNLQRPAQQVWQLFDGNRSLADVVEDSPLDIFYTVELAKDLCVQSAIELVPTTRASIWERESVSLAPLAIEEWMDGAQAYPSSVLVHEVSSEIGPPEGTPASPPATARGTFVRASGSSSGIPDMTASAEYEEPEKPVTDGSGDLMKSKTDDDNTTISKKSASGANGGQDSVTPPTDGSHSDVAFSDDEEAFFSAGKAIETKREPATSFEDMDRGYVHKNLWNRFWKRPSKVE